MIEVTIRGSQDYRLLGDLEKLTPKIPLQTSTKWITKDGVQFMIATYRIDGLEAEDELYIKLKYNGKLDYA
jgi:hypothetical protein